MYHLRPITSARKLHVLVLDLSGTPGQFTITICPATLKPDSGEVCSPAMVSEAAAVTAKARARENGPPGSARTSGIR
jgi:hypothetical protein